MNVKCIVFYYKLVVTVATPASKFGGQRGQEKIWGAYGILMHV